MPAELAVLVPTRGRPGNIRKVISAWDFTNAWDVADLILLVDDDDPEIEGYQTLLSEFLEGCPPGAPSPLGILCYRTWLPMVHKLNEAAIHMATGSSHFALGFAGDDHLPQTIGWAQRYLTVLHELGSGMVFGDDGYQGGNLSTEWAVTADTVRALGRMVPAPVEHMYCDNAMVDLFTAAGALRYLPEVRIEHMHPIAGKAQTDEQYKRVNSREQFKKDRAAYEGWQRSGMLTDVATIRALRPGLPDVRPSRAAESKKRPGSMARSVTPRPRGNRMTRLPIPRHFKRVRGATPDEIGLTLADMATQVPKDQAIVELGVFQGRTALLMAWGARQGQGAHLWGIDAWNLPGNTYGPPFNELGSKTWAEYNVMALGYNSGITLVNTFAAEAARDWTGPPIGLLFVDDDHSKEGALAAVELWAPHLAPGAVIALDDYGHPDWPGVREAVDELVAEGFLAPVEIFHDRLAVTALRVAPDPDTELSIETPEQSAAIVDANLQAAGSEGLTAITSEGVEPLPIKGGTVPNGPPEGWIQDADGWIDPASMNLGQLRALAKKRGIVLGKRKDLRADIIQALRDGK